MRAVKVDGVPREVVNTLSSGPGAPVHTYELRGGSYVYKVGAQWWLQERGQFKRPVTVEEVARG